MARSDFPYLIKARCARSTGGRWRLSIFGPDAPPKRINGRSGPHTTATTIRPQGWEKINNS